MKYSIKERELVKGNNYVDQMKCLIIKLINV